MKFPIIRKCQTCGRGMLIDDPSMIGAVLECPHCGTTLLLDPADFGLSTSACDSTQNSQTQDKARDEPPLEKTSPSDTQPSKTEGNVEHVQNKILNNVLNETPPNGVKHTVEMGEPSAKNRKKTLPLPPPVKRSAVHPAKDTPNPTPLPPPVRVSLEKSPQSVGKQELSDTICLSEKRQNITDGENFSTKNEKNSAISSSRKWTLMAITLGCVFLTGTLIFLLIQMTSRQLSHQDIRQNEIHGTNNKNDNSSTNSKDGSNAKNKANVEPNVRAAESVSVTSEGKTEEIETPKHTELDPATVSEKTTPQTIPTPETTSTPDTSTPQSTDASVPLSADHSVGVERSTEQAVPAMLDVEAAKQNAQPLDFTVPARPELETPEGTAPQSIVWPPPEWNGQTTSTKSTETPQSTTSELGLSSEHEQLLGIMRGTTEVHEVSAENAQNKNNTQSTENTQNAIEENHKTNATIGDAMGAISDSSVTDASDESTESRTTVAVNPEKEAMESVDHLPQVSVDERLKQTVAGADFRQTTLANALVIVSDLSTIPMILDWNAIDLQDLASMRQDSHFVSSQPTHLKLVKTTYLDILNEITQKYGLTWVVERNRFIRITRPEQTDSKRVIEKTYTLSELVAKQDDTKKKQELSHVAEMIQLVANASSITHADTDLASDTTQVENTPKINAMVDSSPPPKPANNPSNNDPSNTQDASSVLSANRENEAIEPSTESDDPSKKDEYTQDETVRVSLDETTQSLTMVASVATHQRVQTFLQRLVESRNLFPDKRLCESIDKTETRLAEPITWMMYEPRPLQDVLRSLAKVTKLTIAADWIQLDQVGVTPETPVELRAEKVSLTELFVMLGDTLPIDFHMVGAGVVEITSRNAATRALDVACYAIDTFREGETERNAIPARLQNAIPRLERYPIFIDTISNRLFVVCPKNEMEQIRQLMFQWEKKGVGNE